MIFFTITLFPILLTTIYQDYKFRSIWWLTPLAIFTCGILGWIFTDSSPVDAFVFNLFFSIFICVGIYFYSKFRFKNHDFFEELFGIGDVLFVISIIPFFEGKQIILFITLSSFVSLILHLLFNYFLQTVKNSIPFAGNIAGLLLIHLISKHYLDLNILNLIHE